MLILFYYLIPLFTKICLYCLFFLMDALASVKLDNKSPFNKKNGTRPLAVLDNQLCILEFGNYLNKIKHTMLKYMERQNIIKFLSHWQFIFQCSVVKLLKFVNFEHRNWIKVDIQIYQYIHKKLNCTGIWKLSCFKTLYIFCCDIEFEKRLVSDNRHLAANFSNGVNNRSPGAI